MHNTFLKYILKLRERECLMPHTIENIYNISFQIRGTKSANAECTMTPLPEKTSNQLHPDNHPFSACAIPILAVHTHARLSQMSMHLITVPNVRQYIPRVKEMDHLDIISETQLTINTNAGKIKNRIGIIEHLQINLPPSIKKNLKVFFNYGLNTSH